MTERSRDRPLLRRVWHDPKAVGWQAVRNELLAKEPVGDDERRHFGGPHATATIREGCSRQRCTLEQTATVAPAQHAMKVVTGRASFADGTSSVQHAVQAEKSVVIHDLDYGDGSLREGLVRCQRQ